MARAAVFALVLFLIQSLEGTAFYFSIGCATFVMIATLAFNLAGGLSRASGAYVFFYAMLDVIVGLCYKAFLGEPAHTNLADPKTTILVYVAGITAMLAAVVVSRRFSRKTGLLQNMLQESQMYRACIGCILFGAGGAYLIALLGHSGEKLNSAFTQLNELIPLGIIIGVMYEIRRSGGTRSTNLPVVVGILHTFIFFGILGFSKQGMLEPMFCWAIAVFAGRFRLSTLQIVSLLVWTLIVFEFLVPYSQYGRRFVMGNPTTSQRLDVAVRLLSDPQDVRKKYKESEEATFDFAHYYNGPEGFWDRLQFIATDDSLINITDQGKEFGYMPITASYVNVVPRVIMPNKPTYNFGNTYAHEIGYISVDDYTTGISFSPTAEAFHLGKWVGLLVAAPLVWTLMFIVLDSLLGDLRATPWGLLAMAMISHAAPETGIVGVIYMTTFGAEILTFCAVFSRWVAPAIASLVLGRPTENFTPIRLPTGFRGTVPAASARSLD